MIRYACIAGDERGVRCRTFLDQPGIRCEDHQESWQPPPEPDIIRICFTLQPQWSRALQRAGISRGEAKKREEQAQRIVEHAESFGQKPWAYRQDFPDSGTLAMYTQEEGIPEEENLRRGLKNVSLWPLFKELLEEFSLGQIFIQPRERKLDRLIVPFYREWKGPPPSEEASSEKIERLLEQFVHSWNVHIYVNPPRGDGKIVHTVNAHGRREEALFALFFNHGLWVVEPA